MYVKSPRVLNCHRGGDGSHRRYHVVVAMGGKPGRGRSHSREHPVPAHVILVLSYRVMRWDGIGYLE